MRALMITLAALLVYAVIDRIGALRELLITLDRKSLDVAIARYRGPLFPRGVTPPEVLIIAIDDSSIARLGPYSRWPRSYHARLLRNVSAGKPRSVGLDILMTEPDVMPEGVIHEYVARLPSQRSILEKAFSASFDSTLAQSLRQSHATWLAYAHLNGREFAPVRLLADAACGLGHVNVEPDADGIVRRVRTAVPRQGGAVVALGIALAQGGPCSRPADSTSQSDVPLEFVGGAGSFMQVSYVDALTGTVPADVFAGRIVLVGFTAAGMTDVFATPFARAAPGVELHATLARQSLLHRVPREAALPTQLFAFALLACLAAMALLGLSAPLGVTAALGLFAAYFVVNCEAYRSHLVWLNAGSAVAPWLLAVIFAAGYRFQIETRGRLALKRVFSRYVAPDVVDQIARDPAAVELGGEEREITVVFVDIRGFTAISERLSAQQLTAFLNEFLDTVTAIVLRHLGTLDKYVGDEVMAIFGAPARVPDHADRACRAALEICQMIESSRERWRQLHVPEVNVAIGINTGTASVGNFGSSLRFDYTAIGDVVNIAARLQALNRQLGTNILAGLATRTQATQFEFAPVGIHTLKGKSEGQPVFRLLEERAAGVARSSQETTVEVPV